MTTLEGIIPNPVLSLSKENLRNLKKGVQLP